MQQSQSLLCFSWVILRFGVEVVVSAASTRMAAASAEAPWGCSQRSRNNLGCPFHSGCGLLPTSRLVPISPHKKMTSVAGLPCPTSLKARPLCSHCVARDSCSDYSSRSCMLSSYREEKQHWGDRLDRVAYEGGERGRYEGELPRICLAERFPQIYATSESKLGNKIV